MKKKRRLSLFLSFLLLFNFIGFANPQVVKAADNGVAYVYIVSCSETAGSSGENSREHTFLVVKNLTDSTLTVGHYNLGGNHIMSIGSYGNIYDGKYAYYNVEKYRISGSAIETPEQIYNKIAARSDCRYDFEFGSTRECSMDNVYVHTSSGKNNLSQVAQLDVTYP